MKITYRESGGFAGLVRGTEIDTALLEQAEAQKVTQLVQRSGIQGQKEVAAPQNRDTFQYEIRIEQDAGVERVCLDSSHVAEQIKPLLKYLKQRARPRRVDEG